MTLYPVCAECRQQHQPGRACRRSDLDALYAARRVAAEAKQRKPETKTPKRGTRKGRALGRDKRRVPGPT